MAKRRRDRKSLASAAPSGPANSGREPGRFSVRRKTEAILRLLRGETLDSLARTRGPGAARTCAALKPHDSLLARANATSSVPVRGDGTMPLVRANPRNPDVLARAKVGRSRRTSRLYVSFCSCRIGSTWRVGPPM
jgi:hypothetical protein